MMPNIEPSTRFLLCRPAGGFNDALVQIEYCRRYAQKFGRVLTIDMTQSGMSDGLVNYFKVNKSIGVETVKWTLELQKKFNNLKTVIPTEIANSIGQYQAQSSPKKNMYDVASGMPLTFDHTMDYTAQLLVHHQSGGGLISICILRHLSFTKPVANEIAMRILPLGRGYDAVHIRGTDYKSDFDKLFRHTREAFLNRRVLVCSDSNFIIQRAGKCYNKAAEIMSVSDIQESDLPLHHNPEIASYSNNINMLCDLMALARADNLVFTRTKDGPVSGFSLLAEGLRSQPKLMRSLMKNADADYLEALFGPPQNFAERHNNAGYSNGMLIWARRIFALKYQWMWNNYARGKARKMRRMERKCSG